jgi:hypothetical protein
LHKIAPVNQKNKTVNLSTRIDKIIYDQLVEDAAKKGISLNSLMNSIAKHHITWKRYADEIGFVPITKRMLGKIFKYLDKESIEKMAKELGGTVPKELLYLTYDKMNFENFVQILEINALRFGVVHHKENDGKHTINIHHGISENFSHFLASGHKAMADDLSLKLTITNEDKNMICFEIEDPKNIS